MLALQPTSKNRMCKPLITSVFGVPPANSTHVHAVKSTHARTLVNVLFTIQLLNNTHAHSSSDVQFRSELVGEHTHSLLLHPKGNHVPVGNTADVNNLRSCSGRHAGRAFGTQPRNVSTYPPRNAMAKTHRALNPLPSLNPNTFCSARRISNLCHVLHYLIFGTVYGVRV